MNGKVVIITGGASGIGRATAIAFAREGATVVIGDLDKTGGENTVAAIKDTGGSATFIRVDVGKSADVARWHSRRTVWWLGLRVQQCRTGWFVCRDCGYSERRLGPCCLYKPDGRMAVYEI